MTFLRLTAGKTIITKNNKKIKIVRTSNGIPGVEKQYLDLYGG